MTNYEITKNLIDDIRAFTEEEVADLDNYNGPDAGFPISIVVSEDEILAEAGHNGGAFWFNVDIERSNDDLLTEIAELIDTAIEFQAENEAA